MKNLDLEKAVLGAILIDPPCLSVISPLLKVEFFSERSHQIIYQAINNLFKKSDTIDLLTITNELKKLGRLEDIGGAFYVSRLSERVASSANAEAHVRKLNEYYIIRELSVFGQILTQQAAIPSTDCFELLGSVQTKLTELTSFGSNSIKKIGDLYQKLIDEIKEVQSSGKLPGIPSGLKNLDKITGGWQKKALYVLAARPGMGKTAFALSIAKSPAIEFNIGVGIFSLEMSDMELVGRMVSSESEINATKVNQKTINHAELMTIGGRCMKLQEAPIYIDDTPGLKMIDLKAKARRLVYDHDVKLLIVDYLQLMHGDEKSSREQEISFISRNLKGLAKELDVPIISLSQLSRKVEERSDKRPQLSDLRESGAIEQDADVVAFLFRPEYYNLHENGYEYNGKTLNNTNLLLFDIAKGRGLQTGEVPLKFYGEYMTVANYDLGGSESYTPSPLTENTNFL